jgi:hypothetical protein
VWRVTGKVTRHPLAISDTQRQRPGHSGTEFGSLYRALAGQRVDHAVRARVPPCRIRTCAHGSGGGLRSDHVRRSRTYERARDGRCSPRAVHREWQQRRAMSAPCSRQPCSPWKRRPPHPTAGGRPKGDVERHVLDAPHRYCAAPRTTISSQHDLPQPPGQPVVVT